LIVATGGAVRGGDAASKPALVPATTAGKPPSSHEDHELRVVCHGGHWRLIISDANAGLQPAVTVSTGRRAARKLHAVRGRR
jgi:hypothetical protein